MERRSFLNLGSLALGGVLVPVCGRAVAAEELLIPMAVKLKKMLADTAMTAATSAGASYCDVRIGRYLNQFITTRDLNVENVVNTESAGVGVRVLAGGAYGFAATNDMSPDGVAGAARQAVAIAKANAKLQGEPVRLAPVKGVGEVSWATPVKKDWRKVAIKEKADLLIAANKAGFDAGILSGGSTGTYNIDSTVRGVTELQVGSYVFMDIDYRRIGGKSSGENYTDFQHSLTVLATVVNATHSDRVSVDAGTKAIDTTTTYKPEPKGWPNLSYNRGGDEFGILTAEAGAKLPLIGDRIEFIVPHCDPTTYLYDRIYAMRGEQVEAIWPIAARREERKRPVG